MSTFKGFLKDPVLDFIAIDYFKPPTYKCTVFMLSHIHYDHTEGLFNKVFLNLLTDSEDKFLYCSTITAHLLTKMKCDFPKNKIIILEINQPFILRHGNVETDVVVTALAAGHCPGSTMFMFEYNYKRCLYTGDVRIDLYNLKKMKSRIANIDGSAMKVNDLYLDTTFAVSSNFDDFPSREDCKDFIIDRIGMWLNTSTKSNYSLKVVLQLPYRCGLEYLYSSFYKHFKKRVAIHDYHYYLQIEEMRYCVSPFDDHNEWFIHACIRTDCSAYYSAGVRIIKPCVLSFMNPRSKFKNLVEVHEKYKVPFMNEEGGVFRFLYSSHCSLNELRDIVEYLKPDRIYPNVVAESNVSIRKVLDLLRSRDLSTSWTLKPIDAETRKSPLKVSHIGRTLKKTVPKRSREEEEARYQNIMKKLKLEI